MISYLLTGAACAILGMASGQALVLSMGRRGLSSQVRHLSNVGTVLVERVDKLEKAVPSMITRTEVENAFAQVAQIEAQRQNAAMQQARAQAVFGAGPAPADLNTAINAQLDSLSERINRINQEFGVRS